MLEFKAHICWVITADYKVRLGQVKSEFDQKRPKLTRSVRASILSIFSIKPQCAIGWAPIPGCDPYEFVLTPLLWVPIGRLHVNFQRGRPTHWKSPGLQSFGLTVLEAGKWRSSNQAEIKILLYKLTLQIPKITIISLQYFK